ncbi:MAG: hypothetical protein O2955_14650 [Planctomycetota bacterium]|nr:hypothetical protein [Planctomycetota bacterium]
MGFNTANAQSADGRPVEHSHLTTETTVTRDGKPVTRTLRPMTPRGNYETPEQIRARYSQLKSELGRGRNSVPVTERSATTTTYRAPADEFAPSVTSSHGSIPIVQVQNRRIVDSNDLESSEPSAVQQKLQELYDRNNLEAPPMTLKELKRQDGRRFAKRAPKIEADEEKPSLLQRLNPFSRFVDKEDSDSQLPESAPEAVEIDEAFPSELEHESKIRKLTKHYRRPTQSSSDGAVPAPPRTTAKKEVKQPASAERVSTRKNSRSDVDAAPAVSKRTTRNDRKPTGDLPVIVPQADPAFSEANPSADLPTVVPEGNGEFDLDLPLPVEPGTDSDLELDLDSLDSFDDEPESLNDQFTDETERDASTPPKLSKIDTAREDHKLVQIPAEIDPATEAKMQQIAARGSVAGMKGFCPVTLKNNRELKDAKPEFNSIYQGVVYGFSSREAKEEFDNDPEQFVPAIQGRDIVLKASNVDAPGSLDYALWYRHHLYLFSSPETMQEFSASPEDYAR